MLTRRWNKTPQIRVHHVTVDVNKTLTVNRTLYIMYINICGLVSLLHSSPLCLFPGFVWVVVGRFHRAQGVVDHPVMRLVRAYREHHIPHRRVILETKSIRIAKWSTHTCVCGDNYDKCDIQNRLYGTIQTYSHPVITARNSSCGKVAFSQVCVKNSVLGGGVCLWSSGMYTPLARHTPQADTPTPYGIRSTSGRYASTGMHSCFPTITGTVWLRKWHVTDL